jgi:hypothetical protein
LKAVELPSKFFIATNSIVLDFYNPSGGWACSVFQEKAAKWTLLHSLENGEAAHEIQLGPNFTARVYMLLA